MKWPKRLALAGVFLACSAGGYFMAYGWQPKLADPKPSSPSSPPLQALGGWLRLLPEQVEVLANVDPEFDEQRAALEGQLVLERERLASMFEDASASNEAILQQVEKLIEIHDQLERRVAAYLLALRPHLTVSQRTTLFERCAEGVREAGGRRWRHGQRGRAGPPPGRGQGFGHGRE